MTNHRIGLSTKVVQDLPMREAAEVAARAGYTGLEIFGVPNHLPPDTDDARLRAYRRLFDGLGLRTVTICSYAGGFAELGDAECRQEVDLFRRYLEMADALGCPMVRVWADKLGRNLRTPRQDHWLRAAHYVALCADHALDAGKRVLLENHLAMTISADMTLRLLRLVDRPNVVVNFDPGNMFLAGEPYGRAATLRLRPHVGNVQVKDGYMPASPPAAAGTADATLSQGGSYDVLLGEGNMDHLSYLRPLHETGYDGYYMAECHKNPTPEWSSAGIAEHEHRALADLLDRAVT
ncbi:MAG TPA: sugar phosphate isomerase/epimerase family protein [Chloroflexota bacterium]|nr:sugar phosphate isomerase/epimerase family protein [Chloroflexota bacterium]